jgi:hypothetical protein
MKDVNILYWGEDISLETKQKLVYGEVFTLLDKNLKPYSYVCMDVDGTMMEKKIHEIPKAD